MNLKVSVAPQPAHGDPFLAPLAFTHAYSIQVSPPCEGGGMAQREGASSLLAPSPAGEGWGEGRDAARPSRKSNDSPRDIMAGTRALAPPNTSGY
jgi:hypothetical protein